MDGEDDNPWISMVPVEKESLEDSGHQASEPSEEQEADTAAGIDADWEHVESPDEEVLATEIKKLDGLSMALAHKLEEVRERKREIINLSVHHLSEARLSKVARDHQLAGRNLEIALRNTLTDARIMEEIMGPTDDEQEITERKDDEQPSGKRNRNNPPTSDQDRHS